MPVLRITSQATNPAVSGLAVSVMHMTSASTSLTDAQAVVDNIRDWYDGCKALFHTSSTITVGAQVLDISDVDNPLYVGTTPRTVVGTGSGTQLPAQLALVVSWRTATATRSARGRTYLGPIASSALNAYVLTPTLQTAIQNASNTLIATNRLDVYSRKLDVVYQVTSAVVNTKIDTMRTRS